MEIEKKVEGWPTRAEDYVVCDADSYRELTVTITLHEYRDLVENRARNEQKGIDCREWELNREIDRLKGEIETLNRALGTGVQDDDSAS